MAIDHLTNRETAVEYLGGALGDGTLVLVLGAGASTSTGLPDWPALITAIAKSVDWKSRPQGNESADVLQAIADEIRSAHFCNDDAGFARLVKECLYGGRPLSMEVLRDPLLIAIGALMTGSRRGSVRRVLTLNFDCVLEWYLTLHGQMINVVHTVPYLEGAEDVRIFHPHGFLSHPDVGLEDSEFVILGLDSIDKRLGTVGDPWMEVARHAFRTGICLFIGLSMRTFRDRAVAPLLKTIAPELLDRPVGFWLFREGEEVNEAELLRHKVVPVILPEVGYPEFLLRICRAAARPDATSWVCEA